MASKRTNGASPIPKGDTPGADSPHNPREGAKHPSARTPVQNTSASQTPVGVGAGNSSSLLTPRPGAPTPRPNSRTMNNAPFTHGKQQMIPVGNSTMDSPAGGRKSATESSDAPSFSQMDEYDLMLNEAAMSDVGEIAAPPIPQPIMQKLASSGLVAPTPKQPVAVAPGGAVGGTWPPGLNGGFERSGATNPVGQHSESPGNLLGSQPPTPSVRPGSRAPNCSAGGEERESSPNLVQALTNNNAGSVSPAVPMAGRSFVLSPNGEKSTPRNNNSKKYFDPSSTSATPGISAAVRKTYLSKPMAMSQQALGTPAAPQEDVAKFSNATSNKSTKNIQRPRPSRASAVSDGSTTNSAAISTNSTKTQAATLINARGIAELEAQSTTSARRSRRILRSNASAFSDTQSARSLHSVPSPTKATAASTSQSSLSHPAIQAASGRK